MFEPSRLSPACVAQAYEQVVPITRGTTQRASHTGQAGRARTITASMQSSRSSISLQRVGRRAVS